MWNDYQQRKQERTALYWQRHGKKLVTCTACSGSGRYDSFRSPKCGACGGLGKVRQR